MIGLLTSEWLRFRSRKLIRWLAILAVVGIVVGAVLAAIGSDKPDPDRVAAAERRVERLVGRCIENRNGQFYDQLPAGTSAEEYCRELLPVQDYVGYDHLALVQLPEYMQGAGFLLMLIGLVAGASMVGASWGSGTITTILTWEPRRIRWFLVRLAVLAAGVFLLSVSLLVVFSLAIALGAALKGSTSTGSGWITDVVATTLRIGGVAVAVSLLGASVAMIGRNTAAALGAVFVYMAVFENVVRGFRPHLGRFMLGDSIASVVTATDITAYQEERAFLVATPVRGTFVILAYVVALCAVAVAFLRARDVQ